MQLFKLISKERNCFSIGKDHTNDLSVIIHSDTLFSAICNNLRKIFGKSALEDFIEEIRQEDKNHEPILSSCFHYIDVFKEGTLSGSLYFFPKPLIKFPLNDASQQFLEENPKIFKKIQFISLGVIRQLQGGEKIHLSTAHVIDSKYLLTTGELRKLGLEDYLTPQQGVDPDNVRDINAIQKKIHLYEILEEQKVQIDRKSGASNPFIWSKFKFLHSHYYAMKGTTRTYYTIIPGFYFFADFSSLSDANKEKLLTAIFLMKDEGIGGRRTTGCGLLDDIAVEQLVDDSEELDIFAFKEGALMMNLSLVYPEQGELAQLRYFSLFGRSGYVFSPDNKSSRFKDITFIEEGSIFTKNIKGKLVEVASNDFRQVHHEVFKNGIGFYIPLGEIKEG